MKITTSPQQLILIARACTFFVKVSKSKAKTGRRYHKKKTCPFSSLMKMKSINAKQVMRGVGISYHREKYVLSVINSLYQCSSPYSTLAYCPLFFFNFHLSEDRTACKHLLQAILLSLHFLRPHHTRMHHYNDTSAYRT